MAEKETSFAGSAETGGEKAAPQHPFELTILIGGENWDYVVRTANKVAEHLSEHGEDCSLVSGGGGGCHSVEIVKRDISAEDYEKELLDWHENLPSGEPEKLNNAQKAAESPTMASLLRDALSRVAFLR